ncbi:MAG: hypothetical protein ACW99U_22270, partial [Candidatus Thorarchaeota archaeon]
KTAAEKIQEAIDKQILINANLRKQIGAEDEVVEKLKIELKVRQQNVGASEKQIQKLITLRNEEREITEEIERQLRMREAQERFFQSAGKSGVAERVSKFGTVGTIPIEPSNVIGGARADQRKALVDETKELVRQNAVVQQRIAGNDELADQMEARFEIMKKFPDLTTEELNNLQKLTEKNKELNALLKEQEELEKVRKELAEDFASVIGTAFEDAIINGEKLSDVMQALLDDINRIILRVLVTKPLENFLTGVLTGEDPTGSKAGPGGTPFFGGILGGLFGGSEETATGTPGRTGRAGGVGTPGVGGGLSSSIVARPGEENLGQIISGILGERFGFEAATGVEKLGEAAKTTAGETEGLAGKVIGLGVEKTLEKVTTTTLTSSLFEFQVAVRLATQALNAMGLVLNS